MGSRVSTGIDVLDQQLDGGIPPGSIVLLTAPPASQSELLLCEFTTPRITLYLTTTRTKQAVLDGFTRIKQHGTQFKDPIVRDLGAKAPVDTANKSIQTVQDESTIIIDSVNELERQGRSQYMNLLNNIQRQVQNTQSIAVLHALRCDSSSNVRVLSQQMADVVLELRTTVNGSDLVTTLAVPKFRGGDALTETIKLKFSSRVEIDTSRDIA